ncbi:hypothetical protein WME82_21275 [Sorangium sp. So ce128]
MRADGIDGREITVRQLLYGEAGAEQAYMDVLDLVDTALCE